MSHDPDHRPKPEGSSDDVLHATVQFSPDVITDQGGEPGEIQQPEFVGQDWSGTDIEEAYLKALHAMEDVGWNGPIGAEDAAMESSPAPLPPTDQALEPGAPVPVPSPSAMDASASGDSSTLGALEATHGVIPMGPSHESPGAVTIGTQGSRRAGPAEALHIAAGTATVNTLAIDDRAPVTPSQIIEAALFVGGSPLTAKRLCALLRGSSDSAFVEQAIDELNGQYSSQQRPYEIRLGDGGYRLELRAEYERLRHRVHGTGPKEVRLSQDVLEVLALVAYKQPVTRSEIEAYSRKSAGNLLRQLLQRELIAIRRGDRGPQNVQYLTTPRFLSVFGLGSLDDLPHAEDVGTK